METEIVFRIVFALVMVIGFGISGFYRKRADRKGGTVSIKQENTLIMILLRLGGFSYFVVSLLYIVYPRAVGWAMLPLPEWMRWAGAVMGSANITLIAWVVRSLGNNITPTVVTRKEATLVTHGPYRFVRHPLYLVGFSMFIALGLLAANWYFWVVAVVALILLAVRTDQEEAMLIERFGDQYREYMKRTGRFFPRLLRQS